jgi:cytochrome c oxidase subunit 2
MDRREKIWLGVLIVVALGVNAITLTPLVPWQQWLLWSNPTPTETFAIDIADYRFHFPAQGIQVKAGEFVEFVATSQDVTYGFGVFRQDGTMVFQMQVVPGHDNRITWKFDQAGFYDVRSTEYSGPRHPQMVVANAIHVIP